jgi:hypothetical protein
MTNTVAQYSTPTVAAEWAGSRETHPAVAMAIHAIADGARTPEAIWEAPTAADWDNVAMAVQNYVDAGVVDAEDDGRYPWGAETIEL